MWCGSATLEEIKVYLLVFLRTVYIEQYGTFSPFHYNVPYRYRVRVHKGGRWRVHGGGGGAGEKTGTGNRDRAFSALYYMVPTTTLPHRSMTSGEDFFAIVVIIIVIVLALQFSNAEYKSSCSQMEKSGVCICKYRRYLSIEPNSYEYCTVSTTIAKN